MPLHFAFDVYGTLINPHAIVQQLTHHIGPAAPEFSKIWREKQLEYSFRKGLMGTYDSFSVCTKQALDFACLETGQDLAGDNRTELLAQYKTLDAYEDAAPALTNLRKQGHQMHAFSNGHPDDLISLMQHAKLANFIDGIVSVHDVQSFKPDPKVYNHFCATTGGTAETTWLVSSNPFDILGAAKCGWRTAWIKRNPSTHFDPWNVEPTVTLTSLSELENLMAKQS